MSHARKYGEKPSRPIYVWNGPLEQKHVEKMGRLSGYFSGSLTA
jgi:hypothetical protein